MMRMSRRVNLLLRPRMTGARLESEPIERGCDLLIGMAACHLFQDLDRFHACASSVLASPVLLDPQF